jgi:TRAP-type C4-dicarboxylate transport system substrate-binding protein
MPANEIYQNMSTKVVDGFTMPFEALPPFRLHEVSKYHTEVWISGSAVFAMYMNKAKYAALPADVRQVLDETTSRQWYWKQVGESWDKAEVSGRQVVAAHKNEIYTLPAEERRRWREAAQDIGEQWAADLEAKGLPGKALLRQAQELAVKYGEAD